MGYELLEGFDNVADAVHVALNHCVLQTAEDIVTDTEDQMVEPKSGRHYKGLPRQSSAPGEAPAVQSGDTQASYKAEPDGDLRAIAYSNDSNAARMEFGSAHIAPRPAFGPATERAAATFEDKHGETVSRAIESVNI